MIGGAQYPNLATNHPSRQSLLLRSGRMRAVTVAYAARWSHGSGLLRPVTG
jgi:hypothetical protein